jgi:uncharacterized protein (TIGR02145 family)
MRRFWWMAVIAAAVGAVCLAVAADGAGTFTDKRDGKTYRTTVIGGKTWMAENLNYETPDGSWCYSDKLSASYCDKYGRLYDWKTAKRACPSGWRLSTRQDWDDLGLAIGCEKKVDPHNNGFYWFAAASKLQSTSGWWINGGDEYGFSALPGGHYFFPESKFWAIRGHGFWWTATEKDSGSAYSLMISVTNGALGEYPELKNNRNSVRCVRD